MEKISEIYNQDLFLLLESAHAVHRKHFPEGEVQRASLLSVKTGGCPENCAYCPQSAHYQTGVQRQSLMDIEDVKIRALEAKRNGATRFCMGAAWREVRDGEPFDRVCQMVQEVKKLGLEACCTLGMLNYEQAQKLKEAGLDAYNHNLDSSREYYKKIISTRTYDDRLQTIANVRKAGITVCTGGIIGMGETDQDRIDFIKELTSLSPHPESVTINALIPIPGTPLAESPKVTPIELVRVIATARMVMPESMIRLSAGRKGMSSEAQFLCFYAGANSIFLGDTLLTSSNPTPEEDHKLFSEIGAKGETYGVL